MDVSALCWRLEPGAQQPGAGGRGERTHRAVGWHRRGGPRARPAASSHVGTPMSRAPAADHDRRAGAQMVVRAVAWPSSSTSPVPRDLRATSTSAGDEETTAALNASLSSPAACARHRREFDELSGEPWPETPAPSGLTTGQLAADQQYQDGQLDRRLLELFDADERVVVGRFRNAGPNSRTSGRRGCRRFFLSPSRFFGRLRCGGEEMASRLLQRLETVHVADHEVVDAPDAPSARPAAPRRPEPAESPSPGRPDGRPGCW